MRTSGVRKCVAACLIGAGLWNCSTARAGTGDPPPGTSPVPPSIFTRMLTKKKDLDTDAGPTDQAAPDKNASKDKSAPAPPEPKLTGEAARKRDEANLTRRLAACDQLKLIAVQTRDDALLSQAEKMEQRVQAAYSRRAARQVASSSVTAPAAPAKDAGSSKGTSTLKIDDRTIRAPAEDKP